jgi:hypothetical protein
VTIGARTGDNCAPGLTCIKFAGNLECHKPCFVRADCAAGQACIGPTLSTSTKSVGGQIWGLSACINATACDPISQGVCPMGLACYFAAAPDDVGLVTLCLKPTGVNAMAGGDCKVARDCAPGFRCSGLGFCRRVCYYTAPDAGSNAGACPPSEGACDLFFDSTDQYGICGSQ